MLLHKTVDVLKQGPMLDSCRHCEGGESWKYMSAVIDERTVVHRAALMQTEVRACRTSAPRKCRTAYTGN